MQSDEIRRAFRDFFAQRGHTVVPSASLVPDALDPSVLLTTAGMQPFKPYFLGQRTPPGPRLTSTQKCFRTTDIDEVGLTARHLTLFEMMGNFSFGDYFKEGAIGFAWELSTQGWKIDPEQIWITVFGGDEQVPMDAEAEELWLDVGVPRERIRHLGRKDNFWQAGPTGPCGPCSELYYDRGPEHGCGREPGPDGCGPGCHCDRFLEFWNLVFMQYDQDAEGKLTPLPKPSIDTGAGVERVSALLQGVHSVYETDVFTPIIEAIEGWTGTSYANGGIETRALRVLADHGRAMTFLAADGVLPGNEGRGYILRRIVRRAVSHGGRIGLDEPFLVRLQGLVVERLGEAYPELVSSRDEVAGILAAEEEGFRRTLRTGAALLDEVIERTRTAGGTTIPAEDAFRLHDTYGFPFELTAELAGDQNLSVDEAGFAELMEGQRRRARAAAQGGGADLERAATFAREAGFVSAFVGYDQLDVETTADAVEELGGGRLLVKLRASPFYAEGGGQISDHGSIESDGGRAAVEQVLRFDGDQALVAVLEHGTLQRGAPVRARVDRALRAPTMANHTATHLLHRALQRVLGDHVRQRGSSVRPDKLRFDFSHPAPMTPEELQAVEDHVNQVVVANHAVRFFETSQDEARQLGAMMLFGEKYGDVVRVVEVEDYSRELCGGTHVTRTAEVGPFKILSESSVGQGVRRIEAISSGAALELLRERERAATAAARELRTDPERLPEAIARLREQIRELERRSRDSGAGSDRLEELASGAQLLGEVHVVVADVGETAPDDLLELSDRLRGRLGTAAVVLASRTNGKVNLVAAATPDAVDAGVDAGAVIRVAAPHVGGGGGGRPGMARAGGKDAAGIPAALEAARSALADRLER